LLVVDGDDLFADPVMIDRIIEACDRSGVDYIVGGLLIGVTGSGMKYPKGGRRYQDRIRYGGLGA
jgi:hypothetical protein